MCDQGFAIETLILKTELCISILFVCMTRITPNYIWQNFHKFQIQSTCALSIQIEQCSVCLDLKYELVTGVFRDIFCMGNVFIARTISPGYLYSGLNAHVLWTCALRGTLSSQGTLAFDFLHLQNFTTFSCNC